MVRDGAGERGDGVGVERVKVKEEGKLGLRTLIFK